MARSKALEQRIIGYSSEVIKIALALPNNFSGNYFSNQILRSASSAALNYGEAQSAESKRDFIHKMRICLKELRETHVALQLMQKTILEKRKIDLDEILKENDEIIAIFVSSIKTALSNK